jgi:hypothetical protein
LAGYDSHSPAGNISAALTMPIVVEAECLAAVMMGSGTELSLIKIDGETITANLQPSRGRLVRGRFYRVTFEEMPRPEG